MTNNIAFSYTGFAASIPGAGHIRLGTPCQDASEVINNPRPALIVCDGRGSAKLSHFGAQGATKAFRTQIAIMEPFLAGMLDGEADAEKWTNFCRIMYRTLVQVKINLAEEHACDEKEFDFTVAFAIAGQRNIGCFQVGDGAIVLRQNNICLTAFIPDKGEFVNQTSFLRAGGESAGKFHAELFPSDINSGIAITSDGPEHLMFQLSDMTPGKIFETMFGDLARGQLCRQDIMDYLSRKCWTDDPRGNDDRSLAIISPSSCLAGNIHQRECAVEEVTEIIEEEENASDASSMGKSTNPVPTDGNQEAAADVAENKSLPRFKGSNILAAVMLIMVILATLYGIWIWRTMTRKIETLNARNIAQRNLIERIKNELNEEKRRVDELKAKNNEPDDFSPDNLFPDMEVEIEQTSLQAELKNGFGNNSLETTIKMTT